MLAAHKGRGHVADRARVHQRRSGGDSLGIRIHPSRRHRDAHRRAGAPDVARRSNRIGTVLSTIRRKCAPEGRFRRRVAAYATRSSRSRLTRVHLHAVDDDAERRRAAARRDVCRDARARLKRAVEREQRRTRGECGRKQRVDLIEVSVRDEVDVRQRVADPVGRRRDDRVNQRSRSSSASASGPRSNASSCSL